MGLFTRKPQEPSAWAALPGEPLDESNPSERLDEAPPVDLFSLGGASSNSIVIPAGGADAADAGATASAAESDADADATN